MCDPNPVFLILAFAEEPKRISVSQTQTHVYICLDVSHMILLTSDLDLVFIASRSGSRCRDLLTARLLLGINKASAAFFLKLSHA